MRLMMIVHASVSLTTRAACVTWEVAGCIFMWATNASNSTFFESAKSKKPNECKKRTKTRKKTKNRWQNNIAFAATLCQRLIEASTLNRAWFHELYPKWMSTIRNWFHDRKNDTSVESLWWIWSLNIYGWMPTTPACSLVCSFWLYFVVRHKKT